MSLAVEWLTHTRRLGFAVLVTDHFTGDRLDGALDVTLETRPERPIPAPSGGTRHADGTYRFLELPSGVVSVRATDPTARWTVRPTPLSVVLPLPDPTVPIVLQARPTPRWTAPPGNTVIRARVEQGGAPVPDAEVAIDAPSGAFTRSTWTEVDGECVHPLFGGLAVQPDGRIELTVQVVGETITSLTVGGTTTAGPQLFVQPGRSTRVRVVLSP